MKINSDGTVQRDLKGRRQLIEGREQIWNTMITLYKSSDFLYNTFSVISAQSGKEKWSVSLPTFPPHQININTTYYQNHHQYQGFFFQSQHLIKNIPVIRGKKKGLFHYQCSFVSH